jgi:tetratricopeptide (TPR) repeat protein
MLAEIQAGHLNDLSGARTTIERFCNQPGHAPQSIAAALNQMADWHLKYGQDLEAARQSLEEIIERLPESEQSQLAAQRIAHLGSTEHLLAPHDRAAVQMRAGVQNVGLLKDSSVLKKPEEDLAATAAAYVKQLEEHPLDSDAREKLALIYAGHYQRLDLAADQLEQLIAQPHQPAKQVAHWLNLLADLRIKAGQDYESARETLQRVVDLFPDLAVGGQARQRLAHLKLELRANEKSQAVKLGSYEQNIGLKKR